MNTPVKPSIALITTTVLQVKFFLVPHLNALAERYEVTLILKNDFPEILDSLRLPVRFHFVPIERAVSPKRDLRALWSLFWYLRKERFVLVHTVNPKAGLLGIVAAWFARTPIRIHTFQGEIWANKTGLWRQILRGMDWLVGRLASHLTVVSESERQVLIQEGLISARKSCVLAHGSIGGVNLELFKSDQQLRVSQRAALGYREQDVVFTYLGRLTRDKGLLELREAFGALAAVHPQAQLLLIGPDEDQIVEQYQPLCAAYPGRVQFQPYTATPQLALQTADVLMLPSHREGFGVVIIEAAALGIPAIGSQIYGISDAMVDHDTGLMFPCGNIEALRECMQQLLNVDLRRRLGLAAQVRVRRDFDQRMVVQAFLEYYQELLRGRL
ncbi:glycosyltransferase [Limnobacter sp.]|uniref:glycosyltransferase n=1 Tax=Limnobacter sp. TaxID=2003368 RepID=UPI003514AFAE